MGAILVHGYLGTLDQSLWNLVVTWSGAFLDQIARGAVCHVGFYYAWRLFVQLLCQSTGHAGLDCELGRLRCLALGGCREGWCRMVKASWGRGESPLCSA